MSDYEYHKKRPRDDEEGGEMKKFDRASAITDATSTRRRDQRGYAEVHNTTTTTTNQRRRVQYSEDDYYHDGGGWECIECGTWNDDHGRGRDDNEDCCCYRCGRVADDEYDHPPLDAAADDELDEFGRAKQQQQQPPQWPPLFGEAANSSSYVLDARSGMFYESLSDFFYDPKSKLYFGNKTQLYYKHCPEEDPPCFREVAAATNQQQQGDDQAVIIPTTVKQPDGEPTNTKPTIAIKLTSKVLPGRKVSKQKNPTKKNKAESAVVVPRAVKRDEANIEKWSERGREMKQTPSTTTTTTTAAVPKTASGQPVCLLCRRKFANLEKLHQHEKLSALHKENLEKKKKEDEAKQKEADELQASYRDRAFERRLIHGPDISVASASILPIPQGPSSSHVAATEPVRPEDNLGDSNIGNQMLQKLGWKSGGAIGRQAATKEPGGKSEESTNGQQNALVKDWERIETLAGNQGSSTRGGRGAGIGH